MKFTAIYDIFLRRFTIYRFELFDEFTLRLRPAPVSTDRLVRLSAAGVDVPVLHASDLLATLDLQETELNVPAMSAWLRHLVLRTGDVQEAVDARRRPNVLAHLEFVTIHPFLDRNGRIGRLLMNYALLGAGYPWITIRSDERIPYFTALERA